MLWNRGWDLGDKKGAWGEWKRWLEQQVRLGQEDLLFSATHPLWLRILEYVYKKAMRDLSIARVRSGRG